MLARATSANEFSSWPTVRAEDSESCGTHPGSKGGDNLTGMLRNWPTQNAADGKTHPDYPHKGGNPTLVGASAHWPTPDSHATERTNRSPSDGAATRPTIALAAKNWKTPHGMAGIDHTGKVGAGGEFAKQIEAWQTPSVENFRSRGGDRIDEMGLDRQSQFWHTPDTPSGGGVRTHTTSANAGHQTTIAEQAERWPSPAAHDSKGENSLQHMKRTDGRTDGRTEHESCRSTSEFRDDELFAPGPSDPRWASIIAERPGLAPATQPGVRMLADGAGPAVDESRRDQLRAVGNGAVPLAVALALVVLAREAGLTARAQFADQVIEVAA